METLGRLITLLVLIMGTGCSLPLTCQIKKIDYCIAEGFAWERKEIFGTIVKVNCVVKNGLCH